ncbi:uncharacterized protein [Temnothorax longispinosus]|uniref:uncharacterized protein n=1 Tax=Temnothorax longispinosus TaxID=300112 RepID=UPI003A995FAC
MDHKLQSTAFKQFLLQIIFASRLESMIFYVMSPTNKRSKFRKLMYMKAIRVMLAHYDIGLLKLASPLKLTKRVQAIELAPPESKPSGETWLAGWGSIFYPNTYLMPKLPQLKGMLEPSVLPAFFVGT